MWGARSNVRVGSSRNPGLAARGAKWSALALATYGLAASAAAQGATRLVSAASATQQANGSSGGGELSADGRFVAFLSVASNLVPGDVGGIADVFVRDLQTGAIARESVSSAGVAANMNCWKPELSGDGRFVVFVSGSSNLVPGYVPNSFELFVRDRAASTTAVVSYGLGGVESDRGVVVPNFVGPSISHDGRFVAFVSPSTNLVVGDTNASSDVFVRDLLTGGIERVPALPGGVEPNGYATDVDLSADGRWVVFTSVASNLVAGDVNGASDVFAYDRSTGALTIVSATAIGDRGSANSDQGVVSADGQWVAFTSAATNFASTHSSGMRQVYIKNLATLAVAPVSYSLFGGEPNLESERPVISADGRYVAFDSLGSDLADYDYDYWKRDVYLYDRGLGSTRRISVSSSLTEDYAGSAVASVSADASSISFGSSSQDFVLGHAHGQSDVYVHTANVNESRIECSGNGIAVGCPCGMSSIQNRGCPNSVSSNGALLYGVGSSSVSVDSIRLEIKGVPFGTVVVYVQSALSPMGGVGSVFGDGLSCVLGTVRRLATSSSAGGLWAEPGSFSNLGWTPGVSISVLGGVTAGQTRWYQAFYRDDAAYCTVSMWNATNSFRLEWLP